MAQRARSGYGLRANPHPSLQRRAEANRSQFYAKCVEKFEQLASDGRLLYKARRGEKPYLEGIFCSIIHYYNNTEANTIVFFQIQTLVIHCSRS